MRDASFDPVDKQAGRDGGREDQEAGRGASQVQGADPQDPPRPVPGSYQGASHPTPQAQAHVRALLPVSPVSVPSISVTIIFTFVICLLLVYCSQFILSS